MMPLAIPAAARTARFWIIAALAGLAIAFVVWWAFIRPSQMADKAAVARADGTIAAAAPQIARDTLKEVERTHERTIEIRERTVAGNAAIAAAPGAAAAIPDAVHRAALGALCLHALYRDDPGCAGLQPLRAGEPVAADAGGAPAADPGGG